MSVRETLKAIINLGGAVIQKVKGCTINNTDTVSNNENTNTNLTKMVISMCLKNKGKKDREQRAKFNLPQYKVKI